MVSTPARSAEDGDQQNLPNQETPTLGPITPLRKFVPRAQRRITRGFVREENIEVPEIPDDGHEIGPRQRET